jgi:hypothetical protein
MLPGWVREQKADLASMAHGTMIRGGGAARTFIDEWPARVPRSTLEPLRVQKQGRAPKVNKGAAELCRTSCVVISGALEPSKRGNGVKLVQVR